MTDARARLELERRVTLDRLAALRADFGGIVEASRDSNADDEHDPEGATIAFERSQVGALAQQAVRQLEEVDAALERLRLGVYGLCERCGRQIPDERLEVRPVARTCVSC
jgi:RNA polymerase-binding transcription factor DksA